MAPWVDSPNGGRCKKRLGTKGHIECLSILKGSYFYVLPLPSLTWSLNEPAWVFVHPLGVCAQPLEFVDTHLKLVQTHLWILCTPTSSFFTFTWKFCSPTWVLCAPTWNLCAPTWILCTLALCFSTPALLTLFLGPSRFSVIYSRGLLPYSVYSVKLTRLMWDLCLQCYISLETLGN